jgi:hypothetical protein
MRYGGFLLPWAEQIIADYQRGDEPAEIARRLQPAIARKWPKSPYLTSSNIVYLLRREEVYPRTEPPDLAARQKEIRRMREQGLTLNAIGQKFNLTRERVRQLLIAEEKKWEWAAKRVLPRRRSIGRPLDMGGPRDQWLEQGPWDER